MRERRGEREAWTAFVEGREAVAASVNKYGAKRTFLDGRWYDSQHEANEAAKLELLQRNGRISNLEYQVGFTLVEGDGKIRAIRYVADFTWKENGKMCIGDAKGYNKNQVYRLKKKLMKLLLGLDIQEL